MNRFQKVLIFLISIIVIQSIAFSAVIIKAMVTAQVYSSNPGQDGILRCNFLA